MKKLLGLLSGLAISAAVAATPAQALVVDDFSVSQTGVEVAGGGADASSGFLNLGGVGTDLNNNRRILNLSNVTGSAQRTASLFVDGSTGTLVYENATGVSSTATVGWRFDSTDFTGLLNIRISVVDADLSGGTFSVTVADSTSGGNIFTTAELVAAGAAEYIIAFDFGAEDITDITGLALIIDGVANLDLEIDIIEAVPEPAVLGLMGLGLLGMGAVARRRKAA